MANIGITTRDVARELARRYSTMTHDELDMLESILVPQKFTKNEYILKEGFTPEYGAREMDRVISQKLKPLLMREILFGSLKKGGNITIDIKDGSLSVG